ncbi:DnaJ-domain-containing protein [Copromyces sp. CBS 386.78]|nr:DnaJ-domain-containing protein [Copromyces sp. CBS 386.78]
MVSSTSQKPKQPPSLQCYATLGVSPYADSKALTSAYHRLALLHHPDKNNNSPESKAKFQRVQETFEYLSNHACRKDYDQLVAVAHAGSRRELDESYKNLHEIRQKMGQSEMLLNPGPNAAWHIGTMASYMHKESELLELIKLKSQLLVALDREVRQIPAEPEKAQPSQYEDAGASFHKLHAQYQEQKNKSLKQQVANQQQQLESLQQQVTSQKQQLDIKEAEIEKLRTQEQDAREIALKFRRERDYQINLMMEVDSLKEQISTRDVEEKERSSVVREEKDQLRVLNRRLLREINTGTSNRQKSTG